MQNIFLLFSNYLFLNTFATTD